MGQRVKDDERYWEIAKQAASSVADWPEWRRRGIVKLEPSIQNNRGTPPQRRKITMEKAETKPACASCCYSKIVRTLGGKDRYECHRYPPTLASSKTHSNWTVVRKTDWCGQYQTDWVDVRLDKEE